MGSIDYYEYLVENATFSKVFWDDGLGQLRVWGSNVGIHHHRWISLDSRLKKAPFFVRGKLEKGLRKLKSELQKGCAEVRRHVLLRVENGKSTERPHDSILEAVKKDVTKAIDLLFELDGLLRMPQRTD